MNLNDQKSDECELKPATVFREGIQYLFCRFEPMGYKLLKSKTIKKKVGYAACEIHFHGSRDNYIDLARHCGSVGMEVVCDITMNRQVLYRFCFTKPMDRTCLHEILTEDLKLDKMQMDQIGASIETYFLEFVKGLEENPVAQLNLLGPNREIQADDYTWRMTMTRDLIVYFGNEELLDRYDKNCEEYDRMEQVTSRSLKEYSAFAMGRLNRNWCLAQQPEALLNLVDRIYEVLKDWKEGRERLEVKYQLVKNLDPSDLPPFVTAVYWFCGEIGCYPQKWNKAPDLVHQVEKIYHDLFSATF